MPQLKLGTKIDQLFKLKQKIKVEEEKVKKLKASYKEKEDELMNSVDKESLNGAAGKLAKVSIKKSVVANITDWPTFCKYMSRNKAWDMVQKRISSPAYRARLEDKKKVPGLEPFTKVSLSMTKIK